MLTVPVNGVPNMQTLGRPSTIDNISSIFLPFSHSSQLQFFLFDPEGNLSPSNVGMVFNVGGSAVCTPNAQESQPTFTTRNTNVLASNNTLGVCETLEIEISGGLPPYTVSIEEWEQPYTDQEALLMDIEMDEKTGGIFDNILFWTNGVYGSGTQLNRLVRVLVHDSLYSYAPASNFITAAFIPSGQTCPPFINSVPLGTSTKSHHSSHLAAILAPILSVGCVAAFLFLSWLWMRKQRRIRLTETNKWKAKLDKGWKEIDEESAGGKTSPITPRFGSIDDGRFGSIDGAVVRNEKGSIDWGNRKA